MADNLMPWERNWSVQESIPAMRQPGQGLTPSYEDIANSGYSNAADLKAMGYDLIFNNGKGMGTIINQSPAHEGARSYQKELGKSTGELAATKRGVAPLVQQIEGLEKTFEEAGRTVAGKAIGPNYAPESGPLHYMLPDTAGQSFQNLRALMGNEDDAKAAALNNRLHHFKKGVATLFKAIPGSGKSGATDQAQATLEEMVQAAINSRTPEEFFKITHDAKNFLRSMAQEPVVPEPKSYVPQSWLPKSQRAAPSAPGAPSAPSQGVPGLPEGWSIRRVD